MFISILAAALGGTFLMGFHASAAVVSTVISSRALAPRRALLLTVLATFVGPLVLGSAVANTIGRELAEPGAWSPEVLLCGLLAAISWSLFTWWVRLPSSVSQALIGGLMGALVAAAGPAAVQRAGLLKTLTGLFISPPAGLIVGGLVMWLTLSLAEYATPRINLAFKQLQIATSLGLALTVGANDAQKMMGVLTLGLLLFGQAATFDVPVWVRLACAAAFSLGVVSGGYRLIRTLGGRLFTIRPVHGFVAQLSAALVLFGASEVGLPVSSTQVLSTAIVGVGSAERLSKVRWQVAGDMVAAWVMTMPVTAVLGGAAIWLWKGWLT